MQTLIQDSSPAVSIVIGAYNEGALIEKNLETIAEYLNAHFQPSTWEMILVNDGSSDNTGALLEQFAKKHDQITVIHHRKNQGLGKSLQDGFEVTRGDIVITLDSDLSCSLDHIDSMIKKMKQTGAAIVVATPEIMTEVPWHRKVLSNNANRFLASIAKSPVPNLTHMMRAYRGDFIRSVPLRSNGMEIMPEIIQKGLILGEVIDQIPAHLDWSLQNQVKRRSSMQIVSHTGNTLLTGFYLRPFFFLILPGLLFFLFSLYPNIWMMIHFVDAWKVVDGTSFFDHGSQAIALTYKEFPHTFIIGFLTLILGVQLIGLGLNSLQSKRYFEEIFSLLVKMGKK